MQKQIKIFGLTVSLLGMMFFGAGCSDVFNFAPKSQSTGVYKSEDGGRTFTHKTTLLGDSKLPFTPPISRIVSLESDSKVLFASSPLGGIFKSENGGDSWQKIFSLSFKESQIVYFDVHPTDPNIVFVAISVNDVAIVYRTLDGGKEWQEVYREALKKNPIASIKIDKSSPNFVYIAFAGGSIIKSSDGGDKWEFINSVERGISSLLIHPQRSAWVYVWSGRNLYISKDGCRTLEKIEIGKIDEEKVRTNEFLALFMNPSDGDEIYLGGKESLVYSSDAGQTWNNIDVISQGNKTPVLSLVVSHQDARKLFYFFGIVLYRSEDKGVTWSTSTLKIKKAVSTIMLDKENDDIIYIGV